MELTNTRIWVLILLLGALWLLPACGGGGGDGDDDGNSTSNEIINRFPPLMDCTLMEDEFTSKEEFNEYGILDKNATLDGYGQGQY